MKYSYARVSTDDQSVDTQVGQLRAEGCDKVIREMASRAKADRRQLRGAIGQLAPGDVLIVTRLDRLTRSMRGLLSDTWADSTTPHGRLMLGGTISRLSDHVPE